MRKATPAPAAPPAAPAPPVKATPPAPPTETATPAEAAPTETAAPVRALPAKAAAPAEAAPTETAAPVRAQPAKAAAPVEAPPTEAAATLFEAPPAKAAPPARATPAKATPPRKTAAKKAAATIKAAAAEVAPGIVEPDLTTVPDEPSTSAVQPAPAVPEKSAARTEAWAAIIADPAHSPELLAVAATQTIGPRAQEWVRRTQAAYPTATPDAVARLAVRQFTRFGSVSSLFAAVAGSYAPIALLGAAAFTHAELALHLAAAYGLDPTDRARAADLLVLTRVHPGREDAVAALAAAQEYSYDGAGLTDASWRLGRMVAAQAGAWAVVRVVNHFFPGTSLLAATLTSRGAVRAMAARATLYYRGQSQLSQSLGSRV